MRTILKSVVLVLALSLSNGAMAQSFLKKLSKAAEQVSSAVAATETAETTEAAENNDSIDVKALLNDKINFTVKKIYETNAAGDTLKNEDGTAKIRYHIIDANGNVCSANKAKEIVSARTKEVTKILANVGKGALTGAGAALLGGGNKKDALKGAAAGALTGLVLSGDEIKQIKKLNSELKEYKKTIEAYEKTFNEEGEMKDANADLSDVDGIDFENVEAMSKTTEDIMKGLEDEGDAGSLDDITI